MSETEVKTRAPKTRNVKIKTMNGRCYITNFNVVAGRLGRINPGDICEVPEAVASKLEDCDLVEFTRGAANCVVREVTEEVGGKVQTFLRVVRDE